MVTESGENVAQFALVSGGIADAIGGKQRKPERAGNFDGGAIAGFLLAMKMALEFDVNVGAAKDFSQVLNAGSRAFHPTVLQSQSQRTIVVSGEANQAFRMFLQFFFMNCTFALGCTQLHFGDHAAEVLIADAGGDEQRKSEFTTETRRHGGILFY